MSNSEIGTTAWSSIGVLVKMSVGARKAVAGEMSATIDGESFPYHLHFNVNRGNTMKVLIGLNGWDYYNIRFIKMDKFGAVKEVFGSYDDVDVSMLNEIILKADR